MSDRVDVLAASMAAATRFSDHNVLIESGYERLSARSSVGAGADRELCGFTLAVKDMIDVAGYPTTRGSSLYGSRDALVTASCVRRLEDVGALVVGKANLHEFAWGVTSENPHWGDVGNPRDPHLAPGGSSGGTAAALAAGIARIGLGTDTGGSVRIPAACCGVVGLRPSSGSIPVDGVAAVAPMFDVVGPMATTVADCARMWRALTGETVDDPGDLGGLVVGVVEECAQAGLFARLGARLVDVTLPSEILAPFRTIVGAQALVTHEATFPRNAHRYSDGVRRKLEAAAEIGYDDFVRARAELERLSASFRVTLEGVDLLIAPTLGAPAPRVGCDEAAVRDDVGRLCATVSALRLPVLAIGDLQIIGRTDRDVLRAGRCWENRLGVIPEPT